MAKVQRNPATGKLCKGASGKLIRATEETTDCGCPPAGEDCTFLSEIYCDGLSQLSANYKAVVSGVTICTDCIPIGGGHSILVTGNVNRTYYIKGRQVSALHATFTGAYFTDPNTTAVGAVRVQVYPTTDCTGSPLDLSSYYLKFLLTDGPGVDQKLQLLLTTTETNPFFAYAGDASLATAGAVTNFCGEEQTLDNTITSCGGPITYFPGYGGEIVLTPCPPCAVDCDPSPCADVVATGADDCHMEWQYGNAQIIDAFYTDSELGPNVFVGETEIGQPAGCVWSWDHTENIDGDLIFRFLYVWFDGQDYQAVIYGNLISDPTSYRALYVVDEAADLSCVDGKLAGTFDMVSTGQLADCDATTLTVTLGSCACPSECDSCCDGYHVVVQFPGESSTSADLFRTDCGWTTSGLPINWTIECTGDEWVLTVNNDGGCTYTLRADATIHACPPEDSDAWTPDAPPGGCGALETFDGTPNPNCGVSVYVCITTSGCPA